MGYLEKKLQAIISTINTWKLKTGNFLVLTSNTAPTPFTACAVYVANSNGTPTYANYTNLSVSNAYYVSDGATTPLADSWFNDYAKQGIMAEVKWSVPIRIKTAVVTFQQNSSVTQTSYCKVVGLDISGNETQLGIYSQYYSTSHNYTIWTATINSSDVTTEFYGIRAYIYDSEPTAGRARYIQTLQMTEWYGKG